MNYTEIKQPYEIQNTVIKVENRDITVFKHLPTKDKIDIIWVALQKAEEDGIYNEFKLDVYFYLNIIYTYTDIDFSDEDRSDELALYDDLKYSGILDAVLEAMDEDEYNELRKNYEITVVNKVKYKNTAAAILGRFIEDLPKSAAAMEEIVDNFDKDKYAEVVNFARAANGGRPIEG